MSPSSDRISLVQIRAVLQQLGLDCTCEDSIIVREVQTNTENMSDAVLNSFSLSSFRF